MLFKGLLDDKYKNLIKRIFKKLYKDNKLFK